MPFKITRKANTNFIQDATGAVSRSIRDKLMESLSVFDLMTSAEKADVRMSTGAVDVTAAIVAAYAAAIAGKVELFFPPGLYLISNTCITILNAHAGVSIRGVPGRSILWNKASAGKPTIKLFGAQFFDIDGLVLIGATGFPNVGVRTSQDGAAQRTGFGTLRNLYMQTNGAGIHLSDTDTINIEDCYYWPSGGSFSGGTIDANANKHFVLADGATAVNAVNIINPVTSANIPTIANGGAAIKWNTVDNSQGVHIYGGDLEMTSNLYRSIDFTNVYGITIRKTFFENTTILFKQCRYGEVSQIIASPATDVTCGDGTAPNACLYFVFEGFGGGDFAADVNCVSMNHKNVLWETYANDALDSISLSLRHSGSALQPDQFGALGFRERDRAVNVGEWTTPAFDAADFTSDSGTWVVAAGDVQTFQYALVGKMLTLNFRINTSTITGTPQVLYIKIPGGFTAAGRCSFPFIGNAAVSECEFTGAAVAVLALYASVNGASNWAAGTDNVYVRGSVTFEVQ